MLKKLVLLFMFSLSTYAEIPKSLRIRITNELSKDKEFQNAYLNYLDSFENLYELNLYKQKDKFKIEYLKYLKNKNCMFFLSNLESLEQVSNYAEEMEKKNTMLPNYKEVQQLLNEFIEVNDTYTSSPKFDGYKFCSFKVSKERIKDNLKDLDDSVILRANINQNEKVDILLKDSSLKRSFEAMIKNFSDSHINTKLNLVDRKKLFDHAADDLQCVLYFAPFKKIDTILNLMLSIENDFKNNHTYKDYKELESLTPMTPNLLNGDYKKCSIKITKEEIKKYELIKLQEQLETETEYNTFMSLKKNSYTAVSELVDNLSKNISSGIDPVLNKKIFLKIIIPTFEMLNQTAASSLAILNTKPGCSDDLKKLTPECILDPKLNLVKPFPFLLISFCTQMHKKELENSCYKEEINPDKIISNSEIQKILNSPVSNKLELNQVLYTISNSKDPIKEIDNIFLKIIVHNQADDDVLNSLVYIMKKNDSLFSKQELIIHQVSESQKLDRKTMAAVANYIGSSKIIIKDANNILIKIVQSKKADAYCFQEVAKAIDTSKSLILDALKTLQYIVDSQIADTASLEAVARTIDSRYVPIPADNNIINKLFNSPFVNEKIIRSITSSLAHLNNKTREPEKIIQQILSSQKLTGYILGDIALILIMAPNESIKNEEILNQILSSQKINSYALGEVAYAITDSSPRIGETSAKNMFQQIIDSPLMDTKSCMRVAEAIKNYKFPNQISNEMIEKINNLKNCKNTKIDIAMFMIKFGTSSKNELDKILQEILNSPDSSSDNLSSLNYAIGNFKSDYPNIDLILKAQLISPKANDKVLSSIVYVISHSKTPVNGADQILQSVMLSPNASTETFDQIINNIKFSKVKNPNSGKLLQQIIDSPKATKKNLDNVSETLSTVVIQEEEFLKIFQKIIKLPLSDGETLSFVALAVASSKGSIEKLENILDQIEKSPLANVNTLKSAQVARNRIKLKKRAKKIKEEVKEKSFFEWLIGVFS
ncbi:MAG: hypothetical protein H7177_09010 [Rhizobacter sp.]|nr:hypothetical protein [Bacteriovorax sp.]